MGAVPVPGGPEPISSGATSRCSRRARIQEPRQGDSATLDQYAREPAPSQGVEHGEWGKVPIDIARQRHSTHLVVGRGRMVAAVTDQVKRGGVFGPQQVPVFRHACCGVQDHPHRLRAVHMPHGEARIVCDSGASADHDGIHQGAQAMQMGPAFAPVDVVRMAACRGDTAIHALPELPDDHGAAPGHQWGKAVQ